MSASAVAAWRPPAAASEAYSGSQPAAPPPLRLRSAGGLPFPGWPTFRPALTMLRVTLRRPLRVPSRRDRCTRRGGVPSPSAASNIWQVASEPSHRRSAPRVGRAPRSRAHLPNGGDGSRTASHRMQGRPRGRAHEARAGLALATVAVDEKTKDDAAERDRRSHDRTRDLNRHAPRPAQVGQSGRLGWLPGASSFGQGPPARQ